MLARKLQQERKYEEYQPRVRKQVQPKQRSIAERRAMLNVGLRRQCFTLLLVISALAILITARSGIIASRGYELNQIKATTTRLEMENAQMKIDNAQLKNPQRIQELVTKEYGMSVPKQVYFASEKGTN